MGRTDQGDRAFRIGAGRKVRQLRRMARVQRASESSSARWPACPRGNGKPAIPWGSRRGDTRSWSGTWGHDLLPVRGVDVHLHEHLPEGDKDGPVREDAESVLIAAAAIVGRQRGSATRSRFVAAIRSTRPAATTQHVPSAIAAASRNSGAVISPMFFIVAASRGGWCSRTSRTPLPECRKFRRQNLRPTFFASPCRNQGPCGAPKF
jgi:hypothetical protein